MTKSHLKNVKALLEIKFQDSLSFIIRSIHEIQKVENILHIIT